MTKRSKRPMERVLFVTSEYFPLIKTGGLADVSAGLTTALRHKGHEVRVLLPGYPQVVAALVRQTLVAQLEVDVGSRKRVGIIEGEVAETGQIVWMVNCPDYFDRPGGPYVKEDNEEWPDNWQRFALLCRVAEALSLGDTSIQWRPTVVHCNDWHAGLTAAFLSEHAHRPAVVFTIHNLAYQGVFGYDAFEGLGCPARWWSFDKLEFYGKFSFLKAGIVFSDYITTVSPTYASEILQPEYGYGMEGTLAYHQSRLKGILNGVDYHLWSPESDHYLKYPYGPECLEKKLQNKIDLQCKRMLFENASALLIGVVSRLVDQKGMDLLPSVIEKVMALPALHLSIQWAIIGDGDKNIERALMQLASKYPGRVSVHIGYDESMAHQIESAADFFLMPSRYEPCGLNQIYSLKYGTLPIVRRTGGLADTVVDATPQTIKDKTANGVIFDRCDVSSILTAIERAVSLYGDKALMKSMMDAAMKQSFDWENSAEAYLSVYRYADQNRYINQ